MAVIVPKFYDVPATLASEAAKWAELFEKGDTRSNTGNISFTSTTGSLNVYDTSVGCGSPSDDAFIIDHSENGLFYWLSMDSVLGTYLAKSSKFDGTVHSIDLSSADYTLSSDDYYKRKLIVSVGADSSYHLILPNGYYDYIIINADSSHAVSVKKSGGTAIIIPAGDTAQVIFNGSQYIFASHGSKTTETLANKTLTSPVVNAPVIDTPMLYNWDGWTAANEIWIFVSPTQFTVSGNVTNKYQKGDKIKWTQNGAIRYNNIVASPSYSSGTGLTTITVHSGYITTIADCSILNTATYPITNNYYSHAETPVGFPTWFRYTPTAVPYGGMNFTITDISLAKFSISGSKITITARIEGTTSGTASMRVGINLPIACSVGTDQAIAGSVVDGSGYVGAVAWIPSTYIMIAKYDQSNFGLGTLRFVSFLAIYEF